MCRGIRFGITTSVILSIFYSLVWRRQGNAFKPSSYSTSTNGQFTEGFMSSLWTACCPWQYSGENRVDAQRASNFSMINIKEGNIQLRIWSGARIGASECTPHIGIIMVSAMTVVFKLLKFWNRLLLRFFRNHTKSRLKNFQQILFKAVRGKQKAYCLPFCLST